MSKLSTDELIALLDSGTDVGKMPATRVLTDDERKQVSFTMALNAALIQFVAEGLFDPSQQVHFMMHLQDFAARLYAGESVEFKGFPQTFLIDSKAGEVYLQASETALKSGRMEHKAPAEASTLVEQPDAPKPTLH